MDSRVLRVLAAAPLALVISACDVRLGNLAGRATDEWTHTYPLAAGGQVRIGNTNGKVDIEGIDGNTVEIRAERVARGVTDTAAQELLPRIEIKEDISPDRVSVETARMSGIMFGASFEVRYHVRAPKSAVIDASNTNGLVTVTDFSGKVRAHTTNGGVTGKGLSGGVDAARDQRPRQHRARGGRFGSDCAAYHQRRRLAHRARVGEGRHHRVLHQRRHQRHRREARDLGAVAPPPRRQVEWRRHPHRAAYHQRRRPAPLEVGRTMKPEPTTRTPGPSRT